MKSDLEKEESESTYGGSGNFSVNSDEFNAHNNFEENAEIQ
jgi:hypothetical protein